MIASLRESKANLSKLVERAAAGEEVLISVRGRPKARLSGIPKSNMGAWAVELQALQGGLPPASDNSTIIDEIRKDRW